MPLYEYECPNCQTVSSLYVEWTAKVELPKCPNCGTEMVKIMSVPAKPVVRW